MRDPLKAWTYYPLGLAISAIGELLSVLSYPFHKAGERLSFVGSFLCERGLIHYMGSDMEQ